RLGTGLVEAFSTNCEHCQGRGLIVHSEPIESKPSEESGRSSQGSSGSSRRKRGRDKSSSEPVVEQVPAVAPTLSPEEVARRAAPPVALAMAAHHSHDSDRDHDSGRDTAEAEPVKITEPLKGAEPAKVAESVAPQVSDTDETEAVAAEVAAAEAAVSPA